MDRVVGGVVEVLSALINGIMDRVVDGVVEVLTALINGVMDGVVEVFYLFTHVKRGAPIRRPSRSLVVFISILRAQLFHRRNIQRHDSSRP